MDDFEKAIEGIVGEHYDEYVDEHGESGAARRVIERAVRMFEGELASVADVDSEDYDKGVLCDLRKDIDLEVIEALRIHELL